MQVFLHLITFRENERVKQHEKIVNITFWVLPVISVYISALFMMLSFGLEDALGLVLSLFFGLMFLVFGNFMPKSVQNRTFGLKIKWTLANEENWNATHRFAGKVWVVCGAVVLFGAFLPTMASVILLVAVSLPVSCLLRLFSSFPVLFFFVPLLLLPVPSAFHMQPFVPPPVAVYLLLLLPERAFFLRQVCLSVDTSGRHSELAVVVVPESAHI